MSLGPSGSTPMEDAEPGEDVGIPFVDADAETVRPDGRPMLPDAGLSDSSGLVGGDDAGTDASAKMAPDAEKDSSVVMGTSYPAEKCSLLAGVYLGEAVMGCSFDARLELWIHTADPCVVDADYELSGSGFGIGDGSDRAEIDVDGRFWIETGPVTCDMQIEDGDGRFMITADCDSCRLEFRPE